MADQMQNDFFSKKATEAAIQRQMSSASALNVSLCIIIANRLTDFSLFTTSKDQVPSFKESQMADWFSVLFLCQCGQKRVERSKTTVSVVLASGGLAHIDLTVSWRFKWLGRTLQLLRATEVDLAPEQAPGEIIYNREYRKCSYRPTDNGNQLTPLTAHQYAPFLINRSIKADCKVLVHFKCFILQQLHLL